MEIPEGELADPVTSGETSVSTGTSLLCNTKIQKDTNTQIQKTHKYKNTKNSRGKTIVFQPELDSSQSIIATY